ncbi:hypothetical protein FA10DRAFT_264697 [Acaromyces ingoldii]|uniref:Zn(2)-C6 fungal-type domain-containing protein n=1 Tax=Acaromyces ingoldii TaxID=215250 RepID=A0A316YXD4_9BASI|nr:hypothetical protein FA10DRAFT_264697 [Acaromyces ingoldii]PWN94117.1 hypothetical protein FA10DRAFT_264697 [Acaromyces ingoldii]
MQEATAGPSTATGISPPPAKRRRKSYARRTCHSCRARKQRCEIPDESLLLLPSAEPLIESLACTRCRAAEIPCILDDFDRAARIRIERNRQSNESGGGDGSSAEHAQRRRRRTGRVEAADGNEDDDAASERETDYADAAEIEEQQRRLARVHPEDVNRIEEYFARRRPVTILIELVSRQPRFGTALRNCRRDSMGSGAELQMDDVVDDDLSQVMSAWTEKEVVLWLPFIPSPWSLRLRRRQQRQAISKSDEASQRILETVQYAIAAQNMARIDDRLRRTITTTAQTIVEQCLGTLMLSSPSSAEDSMALQLLAAFPVIFGDPGPTACVAKRVAFLSQRTAGLNYNASYGDDCDVVAEADPYILFCSACVWDGVYSYGNDDYLVYHKSDWFLKEKKIVQFLGDLSNQPREATVAERRRTLGKLCVLLRALCMTHIAKAWTSFDPIEKGGDPAERTAKLGKCLESWGEDMDLYRARVEHHIAIDVRAQDGDDHDDESRCKQRIVDWLFLESAAAHLIISGKAFWRACEANFTPAYLRDLILGIDIHPSIKAFSHRHGDIRMDACDTVLSTMARMSAARTAAMAGQETGAEDSDLIPPLLASGYLLESAVLAMDMFSTCLKFFKGMPSRASSWQLSMNGAVRFTGSLNRVPIEEGGTAAASAKIVSGMLDIINIWKRALFSSRVGEGAATSAGPKDKGPANEDNQGAADASAPTTKAQPKPNATETTVGSNESPGTTTTATSLLENFDDTDWSMANPLASSTGGDFSHMFLNTEALQGMMNDVFGRTEWGDVLKELEGGPSSLFPVPPM